MSNIRNFGERNGIAPPLRAGWWRVLALIACFVASGTLESRAQEGDLINREYPLKALFLYNFGTYVEWPAIAFESPEHPFVIGVLGSAPLDKTLQEIAATKKIGDRNIVVKRFATVEALQLCHILFVSRDVAPAQQAQAIARHQEHPVLMVGESKDFAARGGTVNFILENNKIKFEINPATAKQHQLKISSKLLALAKIVPN